MFEERNQQQQQQAGLSKEQFVPVLVGIPSGDSSVPTAQLQVRMEVQNKRIAVLQVRART